MAVVRNEVAVVVGYEGAAGRRRIAEETSRGEAAAAVDAAEREAPMDSLPAVNEI